MKGFFAIALFFLSCLSTASGQDSVRNRRTVIDMVLNQTRMKTTMDNKDLQDSPHALKQSVPAVTPGFRTAASIPRYCLARGAVVCRLEEYVQLHSPFKLNIGLGGE